MGKIRFNNSKEIIEVTLERYSKNKLKCVFHYEPEQTIIKNSKSGFKELNEHNLKVQADYSHMKYIYRQIDERAYIFTSEKNDYYSNRMKNVKQHSLCSDDMYQTQKNIPTIETCKQNKISYLSSSCNASITNGVTVQINNQSEHFSYNNNDQVNIKELYDISISTNSPVYYHADGKETKLYSVSEITEIYKSLLLNKIHHLTYYNQLKAYVNILEKIDTINTISYGDQLTGEYLETYNSVMEQFRKNLQI